MFTYEDGYRVIEWIQSWHNVVLDVLFVCVTAIGVKGFYLLAIPLIYWCLDKRLGARLCFIFLAGLLLNTWVKHFVHTGRPDPAKVRVVYADSGGGYSFPSGHAQGSLAFWGYILFYVRRFWCSIGCLVLITVMCISRLYLGLHFPLDVLGGLALGAASLFFFFVLLVLYEKIRPKVPWPVWVAIVTVSSAVLAAFFPQARFDMILGGFSGFFGGFFLEERFVRFEVRKGWMILIGKILLGFAVGVGLLAGGRLLLEPWEWATFIRYSVASAWVSLGAPWCFKKWGLG